MRCQVVSLTCTYLLPLRRFIYGAKEAAALADYFELLLSLGCDILVVDGSVDNIFAQHHNAWSALCRHVRVDRRFGYLNDKTNGIHTGIEQALHEKIVLADDDIRYSAESLGELLKRLDEHDVVRPQNYLDPLPWWAAMEAARMLINRATLRTADYSGTCAFWRRAMLEAGHHDGDVLFDNEEMIRHFVTTGADVDYAENLFVLKRPPTLRKWIEQRPRQAYEDFGLRAKTALFFSLPIVILAAGFFLARRELAGLLLALFSLSILLATCGRHRGVAARYFPFWIIFVAPMWIVERCLSSYWALYWLLRYGGYPFGGTLLTRGIGRDWHRGATGLGVPVKH